MRFLRSTRGGSTSEYSLAVGLIAAISLISMRSIGATVDTVMAGTANRISNTFTPPPEPPPPPPPPPPVYDSCQAAKDAGNSTDGAYQLDLDGVGGLDPFNAWCDMTQDGGGWMLLGYNDAPTVFSNFNKSWAEFKNGFGGPANGTLSLGWVGNDRLHAFTSTGRDLLVRNTDTGNTLRTHLYNNFMVGTEANFYRLTIGNSGFQNDTGLFVAQHNLKYFTTYDSDHDTSGSNCATTTNTGWWHGNCYQMSLAGSASARAYWRSASGTQEFSSLMSIWVR